MGIYYVTGYNSGVSAICSDALAKPESFENLKTKKVSLFEYKNNMPQFLSCEANTLTHTLLKMPTFFIFYLPKVIEIWSKQYAQNMSGYMLGVGGKKRK